MRPEGLLRRFNSLKLTFCFRSNRGHPECYGTSVSGQVSADAASALYRRRLKVAPTPISSLLFGVVMTNHVVVNHAMMDHVMMHDAMMNNVVMDHFVISFLSESERRRESHRSRKNSTGDDFLDHCCILFLGP